MTASNMGSKMSKVSEGQAPGGNKESMPLTGARVLKCAPSNLTPQGKYDEGKDPYAPGGK